MRTQTLAILQNLHHSAEQPSPAEHLGNIVRAFGHKTGAIEAPAAGEFFEHPPHEEEGPKYFPPLLSKDDLRSQL